MVQGFVQTVDNKCAKRIIDESNSKQLKAPRFQRCENQTAKSALDRNRDWALYHAEKIIKQQPSVVGKAVVRERGNDSRVRGIYVDGVELSSKGSTCSKDRIFLHAFAALSLR